MARKIYYVTTRRLSKDEDPKRLTAFFDSKTAAVKFVASWQKHNKHNTDRVLEVVCMLNTDLPKHAMV